MSSHHVVRDSQEPALIIHDLDGINPEVLGQLLEWSPVVIVLEDSLDEIIHAKTKIDQVWIDPSSATTWSGKLSHQYPVEIHEVNNRRIEKILNHLISKKHYAAHIVGNKIAMQDLKKAFLSLHGKMTLTCINSFGKLLFQYNKSLKKWKNKGASVEIWPLANETVISTQGFHPELDCHHLRDAVSLETSSDGLVIIDSNRPFMVFEKSKNRHF